MPDHVRQRRRTVQGAIIMAVLAALTLGVFFLNDIAAAFRGRYTIVVVMDRAPGLSERSPVQVAGRTVGSVRGVAFLPADFDTLARIAVDIELPRRVQAQVREDSRVRLTTPMLMSEPAVDVQPGSAGARILDEGDTLRLDPVPTREDLTARAAVLRDELSATLADLRTLSPALQQRLQQTQTAFASIDRAMAGVDALAADLRDGPAAALMRDAAFHEAIGRSRAHADGLAALVDEWRGRTSAGATLFEDLARFGARVDTLRARLDETSRILETGDGVLSRWQRDTAIVRAVNAARASLDSLIAETRRNPLRYFF